MSNPTCDYNELIPEPTGVKYRFFNQPIEQIPKWNAGELQILSHTSGGGLHWLTAQACTEVVNCIRLEGTGLVIDTSTIYVLKVIPSSGCPDIPVTDCPSSSPSSSYDSSS